MTRSRTSEILDAWRAFADGAVLPEEAPRPPRNAGRRMPAASMLGVAAAAAVMIAVLWLSGQAPAGPAGVLPMSTPSAAPAAAGPSGRASPSAAESAASSPASPEAASSVLLPDPGGTCTADQLIPGPATSGFTFAALNYRHAYFNQTLRNAGGACVLGVPKTIGVASADGSVRPVTVNNTGNQACVGSACSYLTPPTYAIRPGEVLKIDFSVSWWAGANDQNGKPLFTPPPCLGEVTDVSRVEFPVASGAVAIDLGAAVQEGGQSVPWRQVCSSPISISFEIKAG